MLKKKLIIAGVVGLALGVSSCGLKLKTVGVEKQQMNCFENAPSWAIKGFFDTGITAVGSAKLSEAGINAARTEALANARTELARNIDVKVSNMVKNFSQTTGIGDDMTVDKVSSSISRQLTDQNIYGSHQVDAWYSEKCGEMFVLVSVDEEKFASNIKRNFVSSLKNEQALWQQVQANNAMKEMDKEISKLMNSGADNSTEPVKVVE